MDSDCEEGELCENNVCVLDERECHDSLPCAAGETCENGTCIAAPLCASDAECDDGLFCNGAETCVPSLGCQAGTPPVIDDQIGCTEDTCDEENDRIVHQANDSMCDDNNICTIDLCSPTAGCTSMDNDSIVPPQTASNDCQKQVCEGGQIISVADDSDLPSQTSTTDCVRKSCSDGQVIVVNDDSEIPTQVHEADCLKEVCDNGSIVSIADNNESPQQTSINDCVTEICLNGQVETIPANDEIPPQGPSNDCRQEVCQGGEIIPVSNDTELPPQGPNDDCRQEICENGDIASVPQDTEVPPQGPDDDCRQEICENGNIASVPQDTEVPPQGPDDDCRQEICQSGEVTSIAQDSEVPQVDDAKNCRKNVCANGAITWEPDDSDEPAQVAGDDCLTQVCSEGDIVAVADDSEVPPADDSQNCKQHQCADGSVVAVADDADLPAQDSQSDCLREVCDAGEIVSIANNDETPPADGSACLEGTCDNGTASYSPNDDSCDDSILCTAGTCLEDGSCAFTPDDGLCPACPDAQASAQCRPEHPSADSNGCLCLTPAVLTCSATPTTQPVLEPFALVATAPNAAAGSTFLWELVGVPVDVDPSAQLLSQEQSATASFTATSPSADSSDSYTLQVTLQEPDLPPQTCLVNVIAEALPDTFEVSLFISNSVDVDLHVIGGERSNPEDLKYDLPYHPLHMPDTICDNSCFYANDGVCDDGGEGSSYSVCDYGSDCSDCGARTNNSPLVDNPNRDCFFENCNICSVEIPDQPTCQVIAPRVVDFDNPADGAFLSDPQDPQLDIDNRRGCYLNASLETVCIPEKVTVEEPAPGVYFVWAYLYGNALATTTGELTVPADVTVELEVKCKGQTERYTRQLSSEDASLPGFAASTISYERIGGFAGYVRFEVPSDQNAACILPVP